MKKYRTIVIDPPWPIRFDLPWGQGRKEQYPVMSLEEIGALPVIEFSEDECDLFLWTTHTYLPNCFDLLSGWGFKYHCLVTWDKALYAYRGRLGFAPKGQAVDTIIREIPELFEEPSTVHSRKPASFMRAIEAKTEAPRLEMFARAKRRGWDVWGNEVESDIELPSKEYLHG